MVEVAVSLPLLILIVIGLVEMGIVFASYLALVNATREGAIYASMNTNLVDSNCGANGNTICTGAHDNEDAFPAASQSITTTGVTTTLWTEYSNRVANDVFTVIGEPMKGSQLLKQDILTVDRPVLAPSMASCPAGAQTTLSQGCPLTITVHYQVQTLLSGVSLPYFNRLGLPSYYQINYSMGVPIR